MDISLLIVSHGHIDLIRTCLPTLPEALVGLSYEIIIIDNLAEPGFEERIGGPRPEITVVQNEVRMGFGANVNKAARLAKGRVLLILNPDTRFHSGRVVDAVRFLESDVSHGIVAARLLNDDLSEQRNFRAFPSMWIALLRGFGADDWKWRPRFYRRSLLEGMTPDVPTKVDWVYGSFMLIRKSVFDAFGGFDEGFFMYYEDVDLCYRLRKAGLGTFVDPDLVFVHHHLRTSSAIPLGSHRRHHINSLARYVWKTNSVFMSPQLATTRTSEAGFDPAAKGARSNPLALVIAPTSIRPLLQLAYILVIAGSTIAAAMLGWRILAFAGAVAGSPDDAARLIIASFVVCILMVQFMLQEFDAARLGDGRGRMIGVIESTILAVFPVALFFVGFNEMMEPEHSAFLFLLAVIAIAFNAVATLVFTRVVSSEGARVGLVVDQSPDGEAPRAPELPIGLHTISEIFPICGLSTDDVTMRLSAAIRARSVDHILLLTGESRNRDVLQIVRSLAMFDVPIWHAERRSDGESHVVQLRGPLRSRAREGMKRGLDLVFSLTALTVLFVPMLMVAVAIKLGDPGPVFFGQPRLGRNQTPFMMLKFRSMYAAHADVRGDKLTTRNDGRITRVGAFLRKTSLDELPQLVNVFKGDMSIVGPRPLPIGFHFKGSLFDDIVPNWQYRHRVRPGITGLSQLKGLRGTPDTFAEALDMMKERVRNDNLYIDSWSIWSDIKIIFMTAIRGSFISNAY